VSSVDLLFERLAPASTDLVFGETSDDPVVYLVNVDEGARAQDVTSASRECVLFLWTVVDDTQNANWQNVEKPTC
jgi:hypothetical protein